MPLTGPAAHQSREIITRLAWQHLGLPYIWGGDDAVAGFDCSGLTHELRQAVGLESRRYDSTAHDQYTAHKAAFQVRSDLDDREAGDFVFWFKDGKAVHTGVLVDRHHVIHAGGGGAAVKSRDDAIKYNAYVRLDRLTYRGENFKVCDPFKTPE